MLLNKTEFMFFVFWLNINLNGPKLDPSEINLIFVKL